MLRCKKRPPIVAFTWATTARHSGCTRAACMCCPPSRRPAYVGVNDNIIGWGLTPPIRLRNFGGDLPYQAALRRPNDGRRPVQYIASCRAESNISIRRANGARVAAPSRCALVVPGGQCFRVRIGSSLRSVTLERSGASRRGSAGRRCRELLLPPPQAVQTPSCTVRESIFARTDDL